LLVPAKGNDWAGVSMYVDDTAAAKGVAVNKRATEIAMLAGRPVTVNGDAFIASIVDDNEDLFLRTDFTLDMLSQDASWLATAKRRNAELLGRRGDTREHFKAMLSSQTKPRDCSGPGCRRAGVSRCSQCKNAYYCSRDCQGRHWPVHKQNCKQSRKAESSEKATTPVAAAQQPSPPSTDGQTVASSSESAPSQASPPST